ncbi:hypothetical protein ACFL1H_07995, partial [Nanoarchaeota archaeon]
MKKIIFIILSFLVFSILVGCSSGPKCSSPYIEYAGNCCLDENQNNQCDVKEEKVSLCNKPYIQVGSDCCLDQDDNGICDKDEVELYKDCGYADSQATDGLNLCMRSAMAGCTPAKLVSKMDENGVYMEATMYVEGSTGIKCEVKMVVDKADLEVPAGIELTPEVLQVINLFKGMEGKEMTCFAPLGEVESFGFDDDEACSGTLLEYSKQMEGLI